MILIAVVAALVVSIACLALCMLGGRLAWQGIRGIKIDNRARCRACRYDIQGHRVPPVICPECGASFERENAVVLGGRVRQPRRIAAGIALIVVSLAPVEYRLIAPLLAPGPAPAGVAPPVVNPPAVTLWTPVRSQRSPVRSIATPGTTLMPVTLTAVDDANPAARLTPIAALTAAPARADVPLVPVLAGDTDPLVAIADATQVTRWDPVTTAPPPGAAAWSFELPGMTLAPSFSDGRWRQAMPQATPFAHSPVRSMSAPMRTPRVSTQIAPPSYRP